MGGPLTVVVGAGNSGTTYLVKTLRVTSGIYLLPEPKAIGRAAKSSRTKVPILPEGQVQSLCDTVTMGVMNRVLVNRHAEPISAGELRAHVHTPTFGGVWRVAMELFAQRFGYQRGGYKDPADVFYLQYLGQAFPTAKFVHAVRDGRAVALSLTTRHWGPTNPVAGAHYWRRAVHSARSAGMGLGDRYFEVRLEDVANKPDVVAHDLASFLEVDTGTEIESHFRRTLQPERLDRWRRDLATDELRLIESAVGSDLEDFGYGTSGTTRRLFDSAKVGGYVGRDIARRSLNRVRRLAHI